MRDAIDALRAAEVIPFGVNPGDAASHRAFIDAYDFPFDLLVDEGLAVARAYDALNPAGTGVARTVVVVGKDGRIIFRAAGAPPPAELLDAVRAGQDEITPAG
ncbi:MAG: redoxin domain-containing protein [Thermomicrobiales bacterium]|nr:redoxin domain-containing protein [Thermomicrobiales bacterium]